jgi:putative membrane protein
MLLVFRANSAYDRWWEGRKIISSISQEISMISIRLNAVRDSISKNNSDKIKNSLNDFLNSLKTYLKEGDETSESSVFHTIQNKHINTVILNLSKNNLKDINSVNIHSSISKLVEYSNSLERIKNTPIPMSYMLHIKMSIFIYMVTLPFGLFHELGLWGVPLVMLVYYIIAGVEIISAEIENPFANDPNDLPIEELFSVITQTLNEEYEDN